MIKIEIGNSYSKITGLSASQEKELRNALSYTVGGSSAYFSGYGVRKKSLLSKRGEYPTGLMHRIALKPDVIVDNRVKPYIRLRDWSVDTSPYEWQVQSVYTAHEANRGIITAPTGTGKSLAMKILIQSLKLNTLVIVPTLEIKRQLQQVLPKGVIVENIDSRKLKNINTYKGIDCLIIDEAHHSASKTYRTLNKTMWNNIFYRFFYTATPFRNDTEETLLFEAIAGEVIYKLDYKTAIKKGYIVPVEAYYIEIPKQKNDYYTWPEVYKNLVVNNSLRNNMIFSLLSSLYAAGKSALCLVKEIQHGNNINYPAFVHGEDDETRFLIDKFSSGVIKGLVGTEGILSEGVDTRACEYVILAGLGKAKSRIMQAVGRGLRKYPGKESCKVILIKDRSHKYTLRHYAAQVKIIREEYGVEPVKLEL